jgi:hypothetical protein
LCLFFDHNLVRFAVCDVTCLNKDITVLMFYNGAMKIRLPYTLLALLVNSSGTNKLDGSQILKVYCFLYVIGLPKKCAILSP